jgi:hypothetical protein
MEPMDISAKENGRDLNVVHAIKLREYIEEQQKKIYIAPSNLSRNAQEAAQWLTPAINSYTTPSTAPAPTTTSSQVTPATPSSAGSWVP